MPFLHMMRRVCLLGFLLISVSGCGWDREAHIQRSNINALFDTAGDFVHAENGGRTSNLYCTIFEGLRCFLVDHARMTDWNGDYDPEIENFDHRIDEQLASQIITDLDTRSIERAYRAGVRLRCYDATGDIRCEINGGNGWQPLPVLERTIGERHS